MKNIPITGEYITSQINRSARRVECAKLYETIARYGVNETVLAMYNDNNQLSEFAGVTLPSLEDYEYGSRVSRSDTMQILRSLEKASGLPLSSASMEDWKEDLKDTASNLVASNIAMINWLNNLLSGWGTMRNELDKMASDFKSRRADNTTITSIDIKQIEQCVKNNCKKERDEVNKLLHDYVDGKITGEAVDEAATRAERLAAVLANRWQKAEGILGNESKLVLNSSNLNLLAKLCDEVKANQDQCIDILNDYPGFFKVGITQEKLNTTLRYLLTTACSVAGGFLLGPIGATAGAYAGALGGGMLVSKILHHSGTLCVSCWAALFFACKVENAVYEQLRHIHAEITNHLQINDSTGRLFLLFLLLTSWSSKFLNFCDSGFQNI